MNLKNGPESKNFEDRTGGSKGFQHLRDVVGGYLYQHGITKGADNKYYDPERMTPWSSTVGPNIKLDKQGRRADIDWGSNASLPGASLMSAAPSPDVMARKMGFKNAAQATAYYKHQQDMRSASPPSSPAGSGTGASSGSLLDRIFALHPSVMLGHVLDQMNKAIP